jgi:hypothetical protein
LYNFPADCQINVFLSDDDCLLLPVVNFIIICLQNIPLSTVPNICLSLQFVFNACFFGTENDVLDSLPNNTINKGRWMEEEHKIFMEEYEKYGNDCTLIAKVLNTRTPAQIKKHAECFFQQNLKTNSAAVKGYQESLSPNKKAQILITNVAEQQNYQQSLSPEKKNSNFTQ